MRTAFVLYLTGQNAGNNVSYLYAYSPGERLHLVSANPGQERRDLYNSCWIGKCNTRNGGTF